MIVRTRDSWRCHLCCTLLHSARSAAQSIGNSDPTLIIWRMTLMWVYSPDVESVTPSPTCNGRSVTQLKYRWLLLFLFSASIFAPVTGHRDEMPVLEIMESVIIPTYALSFSWREGWLQLECRISKGDNTCFDKSHRHVSSTNYSRSFFHKSQILRHLSLPFLLKMACESPYWIYLGRLFGLFLGRPDGI